ncbi:hypothetical protein EVAR_89073_1 [Eumeta japonica]|uniref:Uncharacterized protein n=1 Tax=Eumeta variegata TaxID=151549 RepID=A0A4C1XJD1_EUMVA|nr:hypothetical protein EVAR_89073_1 [Eumeta japonica]
MESLRDDERIRGVPERPGRRPCAPTPTRRVTASPARERVNSDMKTRPFWAMLVALNTQSRALGHRTRVLRHTEPERSVTQNFGRWETGAASHGVFFSFLGWEIRYRSRSIDSEAKIPINIKSVIRECNSTKGTPNHTRLVRADVKTPPAGPARPRAEKDPLASVTSYQLPHANSRAARRPPAARPAGLSANNARIQPKFNCQKTLLIVPRFVRRSRVGLRPNLRSGPLALEQWQRHIDPPATLKRFRFYNIPSHADPVQIGSQKDKGRIIDNIAKTIHILHKKINISDFGETPRAIGARTQEIRPSDSAIAFRRQYGAVTLLLKLHIAPFASSYYEINSGSGVGDPAGRKGGAEGRAPRPRAGGRRGCHCVEDSSILPFSSLRSRTRRDSRVMEVPIRP